MREVLVIENNHLSTLILQDILQNTTVHTKIAQSGILGLCYFLKEKFRYQHVKKQLSIYIGETNQCINQCIYIETDESQKIWNYCNLSLSITNVVGLIELSDLYVKMMNLCKDFTISMKRKKKLGINRMKLINEKISKFDLIIQKVLNEFD